MVSRDFMPHAGQVIVDCRTMSVIATPGKMQPPRARNPALGMVKLLKPQSLLLKE